MIPVIQRTKAGLLFKAQSTPWRLLKMCDVFIAPVLPELHFAYAIMLLMFLGQEKFLASVHEMAGRKRRPASTRAPMQQTRNDQGKALFHWLNTYMSWQP
jgi:hypothetical protein